MLSTIPIPKNTEIDDRTLKLIVGVIALSLAAITSVLARVMADQTITSISASYHADGWARDFFVGSLFAISAFLLAYNGFGPREMLLSKVAAVAALGVAWFPCECEPFREANPGVQLAPPIVPGAHGLAALILFLILVRFCFLFRKRAVRKGHLEAMRRSRIYRACAAIILFAIAILAFDRLTGGSISSVVTRLTWLGEAAGLAAFGVAWLTASRAIPGLASEGERLFASPRASYVLGKGGPTLVDLRKPESELIILVTGPGMLYEKLRSVTSLGMFEGCTFDALTTLAAELQAEVRCGTTGTEEVDVEVTTHRAGAQIQIGLGPTSMYQSELMLRTRSGRALSGVIDEILNKGNVRDYVFALEAIPATGHLEHESHQLMHEGGQLHGHA